MRIKKYAVLIMLMIMTVILSGCVNVTYKVTLKDEGKADVDIAVLYNNSEFGYNVEEIDKIKAVYENNGFKIRDYNEKGLNGFKMTSKNVEFDFEGVTSENGAKIDIFKDVFKNTQYEKGFLANKYNINADVDLSDLLLLKTYVNPEEPISDDEFKKLLSTVNLKLVLELEKGAVVNSNSTLGENKKIAEWVLIPGSVNKISYEATTGDSLAITGTIIILGTVFVIALSLLIVLFSLYSKRRKNIN
jgi:hypothetical protein